MAPLVGAPAADEHADLDLVPGTCMVEGKYQLLIVVLWPSLLCHGTCVCKPTAKQRNAEKPLKTENTSPAPNSGYPQPWMRGLPLLHYKQVHCKWKLCMPLPCQSEEMLAHPMAAILTWVCIICTENSGKKYTDTVSRG